VPQGRVEDHFAKSWVHHFDHETNDGARRVKFAGVAGGVAHFFEHRFVKMAEGVNLVAARKVNVADFVDHVAEQVAVDHAVDRALENCGDDVAPVAAVGALQAAQIGKQPGTFCPVGADRFFIVHEGNQFVARNPLRLNRPVAPTIRRFERGAKALPAICASCSAICSMSSRNFRNMIQVSIGKRSKSPLSPLSFRMMSRQDLTMDESRCAVVRG